MNRPQFKLLAQFLSIEIGSTFGLVDSIKRVPANTYAISFCAFGSRMSYWNHSHSNFHFYKTLFDWIVLLHIFQPKIIRTRFRLFIYYFLWIIIWVKCALRLSSQSETNQECALCSLSFSSGLGRNCALNCVCFHLYASTIGETKFRSLTVWFNANLSALPTFHARIRNAYCL